MEEKRKGFLEEYSLTPINSTFSLAQEVIVGNYRLVLLSIITYYLFGLALYFSTSSLPQEEESLWKMLFFVIAFSAVLLLLVTFIISNLIYTINQVKMVQSIEEIRENFRETTFKALYTEYFFPALGYVFALIVMFAFIFLLKELSDSISTIFGILLLLVVILFLYTHLAVLEKVSDVTTLKDGFKTFFLTFNVNFLKKISSFDYLIFIFLFEWLYSFLSKVSDAPAKFVSANEESYAFIFTDYLFISISVVLVTVILVAMASLMARELIAKNERHESSK